MTRRSVQIEEMYTLVYGYSPKEAAAQLAMHNAEVVHEAIGHTVGMSPSPYYSASRLTARRRAWWNTGVRQAQDALYDVVRAYQKAERDHFGKQGEN